MNRLSRKRVVKQKGLTLVLVTLAMIILLGFAALAIDVNHALLNKTRLQNAVDTAALSAAVLLDAGNDEDTVRSSVGEALTNVMAAAGQNQVVGCSCRVGVATQAGSVRTRNGETLNRTPLDDMWLIHRLVPRAMHQITVRSSGWNWRHPGRSAAVVENER